MGIGLEEWRLRLDFVQGGATTTITANCEKDQDLQFAIRFRSGSRLNKRETDLLADFLDDVYLPWSKVNKKSAL